MDKKEVMFMRTAATLRYNEEQKVTAMREYVLLKQKQAESSPEAAEKEAKRALKRTGVTTRYGNPKKVIVSWE